MTPPSSQGRRLRVGARTSRLARRQADVVIAGLEARGVPCEFVGISTRGDRDRSAPVHSLGVSVFTKEIERALLTGEIDVAVHSLKDMATSDTAGLACPAILERGDPRDVLLSNGTPGASGLKGLPEDATIGTGSPRRRAFLLSERPGATVVGVRGNVPTRVARLRDGDFDALVLAAAGLHRLPLEAEITTYLSPNTFVPAPGQGAIAVQTREDDAVTLALLAALDHEATRRCVTAERVFLREIEGGCRVPAGALARLEDDELELRVRVCRPDGSFSVTRIVAGPASEPEELGHRAAAAALEGGAAAILDAVRRGSES